MESRRTFIATFAATTLGLATRRATPGWSSALRRPALRPPIGLQLYTVREAMKRDLAGTLASVAAIGYTEVEFAGYFDRKPAQIRDLLRANGLRSPATHIPDSALGDDWGATLDASRTVGHEWVVIPWVAPERHRTASDWQRLADSYNEAARQAREAGLRLAHHNHDFELAPLPGGATPLEILLGATDPALVDFEMDVYWLVRAGGDPLDYIARHPGRFRLLHLKDSSGPPEHRMLDVGAGVIDFGAILAAATADGASHAFVEHDQPADPMASVRASFQHLAPLPS